MVGEPWQMYSVLFAWYKLSSLSFLDVENVHSFICRSSNKVFALIIEIEGSNVRLDRLALNDMCELLARTSVFEVLS